jgi:hypothetical protein
MRLASWQESGLCGYFEEELPSILAAVEYTGRLSPAQSRRMEKTT